jgi:hypothetical protein
LASARYQVGPRWALYGSINDTKITHSAAAAQQQDFKTKGGTGGIEYATDFNDTYGLQYSYSDGRYPNGTLSSVNGQLFSPDFHDQLTQFVVKHTVSDKTQISGYVGYIKRKYPGTDIGSFSGTEWHVTALWQITDKTQLTVMGWHELHAYLASQADYFVSKGVSVGPQWLPRQRIKLSVLFEYENQDYVQTTYIPLGPPALDLGPLKAKVKTVFSYIEYTPRDNWIFKLTYDYIRRSSNYEDFAYTDHVTTLGVLYKFH